MLGKPMDCGLPGSSVHGISQARNWSEPLFPIPADLPWIYIETGNMEVPEDLKKSASWSDEIEGNLKWVDYEVGDKEMEALQILSRKQIEDW